MSSINAKVKIDKKAGSIEIEGSEQFIKEMLEKYEQMFSTDKKEPSEETPRKPSEIDRKSDSKKDKRGGTRSKVISPAIDKLVDEGWLDVFKTEDDVLNELKRLTVPGVNKSNVAGALSRRVPDKLDRIKDAEGRWTYKKK